MDRHYEIFRRNFPFIVRENAEARRILQNPDNLFFDEYDREELIGTAVVHKNTILLLCVDEPYRKHGIGTRLLLAAERAVRESGYQSVSVGVGESYLMPGIPMAEQPFPQQLGEEQIYDSVSNSAYEFFTKRGYRHMWQGNCFDMRVNLAQTEFDEFPDTIDGISYRFANSDDLPQIIACTDAGEQGFTRYYQNPALYEKDSASKVLIATSGHEVCGALMVNRETEAKDLGSVGCTVVAPPYRGRHIAVHLTQIGTRYLKSLGLKDGYLGYTYSGLDKLYGYAGYKICIYYAMAEKSL